MSECVNVKVDSLSGRSGCGHGAEDLSLLFKNEYFLLSLLFILVVVGVLVAPGQAHAAKAKLVNEDGVLRCYKGDTMVKDAKVKVGGATYYFKANGKAACGTAVKIGKKYWIFGNDGKLLKPKKSKVFKLKGGAFSVSKKGRPANVGWTRKGSKLRYVAQNGKVQTKGKVQGISFASDGWSKSSRAARLKVLTMKRVAKITEKSWSRSRKLRACWGWTLGHGAFVNSMGLHNMGTKPAWVQRQALVALESPGKNECYSCACTMAMLAYELGYSPKVYAVNYMHAYCVVNGKRYDNMGSKPHLSNPYIFKVTSYAGTRSLGKAVEYGKSSSGSANSSDGFTGWKVKGGKRYYYKDGKKLKSQWVSVKSKRYYLGKGGAAATGAAKVKSKWYVFSKKGALLKGSKTRTVKVLGTTYRVKASGRAAPGWADGKKAYYLENGELACGVRYVSGGFSAFSATGVYDAALTASLRAADDAGMRAAPLIELLGAPASRSVYDNDCRPYFDSVDGRLAGEGSEVTYKYDNVKILTYIPPGGQIEYISFIEAL